MLLSYFSHLTVLCVFVLFTVVCMYIISTHTQDDIDPSRYLYSEKRVLDETNVILVQHTRNTFNPKAIDKFFSARGIDAKITETLDLFDGFIIQVIELGEDVNPKPVMQDIISVSGVVLAQPNFSYNTYVPSIEPHELDNEF